MEQAGKSFRHIQVTTLNAQSIICLDVTCHKANGENKLKYLLDDRSLLGDHITIADEYRHEMHIPR